MYKRNSWPQFHGGIIQSLFETFLCLLSLSNYVARNCGCSLIGAPGSARISYQRQEREMQKVVRSLLLVAVGTSMVSATQSYAQTDGSLEEGRGVSTGGRGTGGVTDPLESQGSLTLSQDHSLLFAVNGGSGEISVFQVHGSRLTLVDKETSGGSEPNAVAQHGNLVYVLNVGGSSNVVGFRLNAGGQVQRIPSSIRFLTTNNSEAASLAFSPNGQFLASAETQGKIQVWNLSTGSLVRTIVQTAGVWSLTFDAKGNRLAAGGHGLVEIWDVNSGNEIRKWPIKGTCLRLSFDQSSQWLAAGAEGVLHVWNVDGSKSLEGKAHTFIIASVAFSPNGDLVATGGMGLNDGTVQLWRVGQALSESTVGKLPNTVEALTFSPDGASLAAGCTNGTVKLWSTSDGQELRTLATDDYIAALAFSSDGHTLIGATGPNLSERSGPLAWNIQTGQRLDESG